MLDSPSIRFRPCTNLDRFRIPSKHCTRRSSSLPSTRCTLTNRRSSSNRRRALRPSRVQVRSTLVMDLRLRRGQSNVGNLHIRKRSMRRTRECSSMSNKRHTLLLRSLRCISRTLTNRRSPSTHRRLRRSLACMQRSGQRKGSRRSRRRGHRRGRRRGRRHGRLHGHRHGRRHGHRRGLDPSACTAPMRSIRLR